MYCMRCRRELADSDEHWKCFTTGFGGERIELPDVLCDGCHREHRERIESEDAKVAAWARPKARRKGGA